MLPEESGPFKPHQHLSDEVNSNIIESELSGGVYIDRLRIGSALKVTTQNHVYTVEKRQPNQPDFFRRALRRLAAIFSCGAGRAKDCDYYISGHPEFCPTSTLAIINGSTWGGSMLKTKFIGRGMHLEFCLSYEGKMVTITTTKIEEVKEFL